MEVSKENDLSILGRGQRFSHLIQSRGFKSPKAKIWTYGTKKQFSSNGREWERVESDLHGLDQIDREL